MSKKSRKYSVLSRKTHVLPSKYKELHQMKPNDLMKAALGGVDRAVYNSLILAYAKNHNADEALRIFIEMKKRGFQPDTVKCLSVFQWTERLNGIPWDWNRRSTRRWLSRIKTRTKSTNVGSYSKTSKWTSTATWTPSSLESWSAFAQQ